MRDQNSQGLPGFAASHVLWTLISFIWYKNILFRCLGLMSYTDSRRVLWALIIGCEAAGFWISRNRSRNGWNVFMNVASGYGIYTVLAYFPLRRGLILGVLSVCLLLSGGYAYLIFRKRIRSRGHLRDIALRRLVRAGMKSREILCTGMMAVMLIIGIHGYFGFTLFEPKVRAASQAKLEEQTIDNQMEVLVKLEDSVWSGLELQEKLDVLQTVANIERHYLGLPNELNVGAANLEEYTLASYNDSTREILLNLDYLVNGTARDAVDSVCHEAYHSLQNRMVEAYDAADKTLQPLIFFRRAAAYKTEFADYTDSYDEFFEYSGQSCEADARSYAEDAAEEYISRVSDYLSETGQPETGSTEP